MQYLLPHRGVIISLFSNSSQVEAEPYQVIYAIRMPGGVGGLLSDGKSYPDQASPVHDSSLILGFKG